MKMVKTLQRKQANSKVEVKNTVGEVVGFGYVDGAGNVSG